MSRYRFELATAADDADLRHIMAETPMAGPVSVSFRREPSYFGAAVTSGGFHQALMVRDVVADRVAGFVSRSARPMCVNGQPQPIDAYAYVLNATFIDGSARQMKGNITLLR